MAQVLTKPFLRELNIKTGENFLAPHPGVPSSWPLLNERLSWQGLPRGELSLCLGPLGTGSSKWLLDTCAQITQKKKWVFWMGQTPSAFSLQHSQMNLHFFLMAESSEKGFFLLKEALRSSLFDLIVYFSETNELSYTQWHAVKKMIRGPKSALMFRPTHLVKIDPFLFSLILEFSSQHLRVKKARHRSTPFLLRNPFGDENLMSQLQPLSR